MEIYKTKQKQLAGTKYREVYSKAFIVYKQIRKKSKRRPYIRSAYFDKQKIFLQLFWTHLYEKQNFRDKTRRAKFFPCAVELIENSRFTPVIKKSLEQSHILFYRFVGKSKDDKEFIVQIKENKKTGQKWLISVFPK